MANLVIVESPAKASTIKSYLGSNYKVIASVGHIRDLPKSSLGIDIEGGFIPHYINISGKGDVIRQLKKEAKAASKVFLATDPDREGEAISWHLATALGIPLTSKCRVTFNEITKAAVKEGIRHPRTIDENLVNSQQARRMLDRLVGYKLSPYLWKNVKNGLSAGRVQSVATRVIVDREEEIRAFIPREYWTVDATLSRGEDESFIARYIGEADGGEKWEDGEAALRILSDVEGQPFTVTAYKHSQKSKQPPPPFTTSTLQQEAAHKLGFQSPRIMKVAQELYEGINVGQEHGGVQGLITYMRTDSLRISEVAQQAALAFISERYGDAFVPHTPRVYKAGKGAQDAHEAIRPVDVRLTPGDVKDHLTADQYKLYKLIWERFVACQMTSAVYDTMSVECCAAGHLFRFSAYSIRFRGYMAVGDFTEDPADGDTCVKNIPTFREGETLSLLSVERECHYTEPPPRYGDASMVKMFEETGIGRPSTYATILTTIISREYVRRDGKVLVPTQLGEVTTAMMKEHFPDIVDIRFTAEMEDNLDNIEHGTTSCAEVLGDFYVMFKEELDQAETKTAAKVEVAPEESEYECEKCGAKMVYKTGRFGRFLACPNYPACRNTKAVDRDGKPVEKEEAPKPESAGFPCELCGADMVIRHGRYGTFYACSNYPKCRNTKQKVNEIGVNCPDCGARVITKFSRAHRMFFSCEKYPECQFSSWDLPLAEKCPKCGDALLYKKSKKEVYCRSESCDYTREEEIAIPDSRS